MACTALQEIQLDVAHLAADVRADRVLQHLAGAGRDGVAEGVLRLVTIGIVTDHLAAAVTDTLTDGDDDILADCELTPEIGDEVVEIERTLLKIDEIRNVAVCALGEGCSRRQPAGIPAHHLDDDDVRCIVYLELSLQLGDGGRDILRGGAEAWAVIDAVEVVIDGFRCADHDDVRNMMLLNIIRELPDGIHRVVAADIDEIADLVLLEDADERLELRRILCRILQLETAGAKCSGRGHGQGVEHVLDVFDAAQIQELFTQYTLDTIACTEHLAHLRVSDGGLDDAGQRGVDGGRRSTGLCD